MRSLVRIKDLAERLSSAMGILRSCARAHPRGSSIPSVLSWDGAPCLGGAIFRALPLGYGDPQHLVRRKSAGDFEVEEVVAHGGYQALPLVFRFWLERHNRKPLLPRTLAEGGALLVGQCPQPGHAVTDSLACY